MIGAILLSVSVVSGLAVWLLGIRRYLSRHGGVVITSATWGASAWADWQQCSEYARARHDAKAAALAKAFLAAQIGCVVGIILIVCSV
ncbi:MAG TPA: hypothetical protein VHI52_13835 [Verrucomicrobiae bacterium]|nr:hypothetical protein [Verrucomicrobiae bacterium]